MCLLIATLSGIALSCLKALPPFSKLRSWSEGSYLSPVKRVSALHVVCLRCAAQTLGPRRALPGEPGRLRGSRGARWLLTPPAFRRAGGRLLGPRVRSPVPSPSAAARRAGQRSADGVVRFQEATCRRSAVPEGRASARAVRGPSHAAALSACRAF